MQFLSKRSMRLIMAAFSGLLLGLTLMYPVLGALEWFALVPFSLTLFYTLEIKERLRTRIADLLVFFGAYFLPAFHWFLYMYPTVIGMAGKVGAVVIVLVAWIGLSFLASVLGTIVFLCWKPLAGSALVKKHKWLMPFLAAALWVIFEWATSLTWAGVPWARLGLGQTKMLAVIQSISLFGPYFITFLIVAVGFGLGYVVYYRRRLFLAVPIVMFAVNLIIGSIMLNTYEVKTEQSVTVAAVQGNIPSAEKWDETKNGTALDRHLDLTLDAGEEDVDIVVWSETAVPYLLNYEPDAKEAIFDCAAELDCMMLVGALDWEDGKIYNAVFAFGRDGTMTEQPYYKRHLVPFGEFTPWREILEIMIPPLANTNALGDDFSPGLETRVMETEYGNLGFIICFDSIYEDLTRESVLDGAQIMFLSTNDSWFGDSAALYMHNAQSVLRAVENRRYIVRSANTGISSIVSPTGEILSSLGEGKAGYLVEEVYMHSDLTLYTRIGNVFVAFCGVYIVILLGTALIDKKKKAA